MEIRRWSWLMFPLFVGVVILISYGWLVAGPNQIWQKLWVDQEKVKAAEIEVARLKSKLDALSRVNVADQREILAALEKATPSQMRPMLLIGEMTVAASESGVVIEKYKTGGDRSQQLEVSLQTGDAGKLIEWINHMEKWIPLVSIVRMSYTGGQAEVTVEQMWKGFVASGARPEDELPEMGERTKAVMSKISGYRELTTEAIVPADDGTTNPNPF